MTDRRLRVPSRAADTLEPVTVVRRIDGRAGRLTLDRPRAINALDLGMIRDLAAALAEWRDDPAVEVVVLDGAGDRGFCAGGDVVGLRAQITGGDPDAAGVFFREEYALNLAIAEYPKPVVALADGVTMGGGVGLAGHASLRVVTERSRLAMPETRIGFTPDVGGSWLLGRAPGRLGEYLALTGSVMDAADALTAGFADRFVPSGDLDEVRASAAKGLPHIHGRVDELTGDGGPTLRFAPMPTVDAGSSRLDAARDWIDDAFAADTVAEIRSRLAGRSEPEARAAADILAAMSPTALAVALEAVRRARSLTLREALEQEYGLVMWFVTTQPDLVEGIRAQLVDRDRSPRWHPDHDPGPEVVADAFAYRPAVPLWP